MLWSDTAIKLLDIERECILPSNGLRHYCLPANVLFFAYSGQGRLLVDGISYTIHPLFVCHAGRDAVIDFAEITEPIEYIAIYYKAELMSSDRREGVNLYGEHDLLQVQFGFSLAKQLPLHQLVEQIGRKWKMNEDLEGFHANALLQGLLYELLKQSQTYGYRNPSEAVNIVTKHIDAHYSEPLRLDMMAELVHCSSRQLQRWFKQQKQLKPKEYVIKVRMSHAAQLLEETTATLREIAESIGYRDMFYFSRAFKKHYGITPLDYRRAALADKVSVWSASGFEAVSCSSTKDGLVIKHVKGELQLQQLPKRIAVLDIQYADQLTTLNEQPVGSVGIGGAVVRFPDYLQDKLGHSKALGTYEYPNMEAISLLQPDLIVCTEVHEQLYAQLSGFAATIMFQRNEDWRTILRIFGFITGKQAEANQILLEYREKAAGLSSRLADTLQGQRVALIRPRDGSIRIHTAAHRTGAVLYEDLGLPEPSFITQPSDTAYHISLETLPEVKADHYFLLSNELFRERAADMQYRTVQNSLNAIKEQSVYTVDAATWIGSYGPTGINRILDEVAQSLLA
ncbi:helix-turn-helix domain-containing protein [Paenibacillus glucanolyticus]|uniref:helix-turn-helix domain-containing protein n=1 Tax=Paenibacillus glucanolyticus TaxID=59843 RepID=UPI0015C3910B|nr:helix-turn-helix domain-containing protein [Paenibacillus glucanolyticus]